MVLETIEIADSNNLSGETSTILLQKPVVMQCLFVLYKLYNNSYQQLSKKFNYIYIGSVTYNTSYLY